LPRLIAWQKLEQLERPADENRLYDLVLLATGDKQAAEKARLAFLDYLVRVSTTKTAL
jgi:hypothetical protein